MRQQGMPQAYTTSPLLYAEGEAPLEGVLFLPENPRAAILLVHEFMGLGEYVFRHGRRLAEQGYAVLACDMYGKGIRPADAAAGSAEARLYRTDRIRMRTRLRTGFDTLAALPAVQGLPIMSLGFSFGGCAVLELARSGAPVVATCSVYGYLNSPLPLPENSDSDAPSCGPLLVLHGAHDRVVPLTEVAPFADEMRRAGVDCRIVMYTEAGHGFCNELLIRDEQYQSWYCPKTAARAWQEIFDFFAAVCDAGMSNVTT